MQPEDGGKKKGKKENQKSGCERIENNLGIFFF